MTTRAIVNVVALAAVAAAGIVAWRFAFLLAPLAWTGEAAALVDAPGVRPGICVADVGAGDGAMAEAMVAAVGPGGRVLATELSTDRLRDLAERKTRRGLATLEVVAARSDSTGLPDGACDAVYLRHVFHHLPDRPAMVARLSRATMPGGASPSSTSRPACCGSTATTTACAPTTWSRRSLARGGGSVSDATTGVAAPSAWCSNGTRRRDHVEHPARSGASPNRGPPLVARIN
jgi:2-polyprenyl-3-methyl-5-hydroxy-6-metoxy-1,4-benzoquinol methylase